MPDPSPEPTRRPQMWLIVVILCLAVGQFLFQQNMNGPNPSWAALAVVALGVGALFLSHGENRWVIWMQARLSQWRPAAAAEGAAPGRDWAIMVSALLTLFVLAQLPRLRLDDNYTLVAAAWVAAALFFLYGITPPTLAWPDSRRLWADHRPVFLALVGIVLLAFLLRVWQVGIIPKTLNGDEASQGLEAIRVLNRELRNPFGTGWLGVPSFSFFFNSVTIRLMGPTVTALRLPWVFIGTLTVLFTFLLVRRLKGDQWGLAAAALVATYHYHIHYSRLGSNQIADPFFLVTTLWLFYRGLDKKSALSFALSGMVCGLAFYFYAGARLTPVVLLATVGYLWLREPRAFTRTHGLNLLIMVGAFMVVFAPMGQFAIRFPDDFNARLNMVGIFQSGWVDAELARGRTLPVVLWDQLQRAFLAFNHYPDRTVWYGLRQPLLDPFFGTLFLLGLGYGTLRLLGRNGDPRLAPMVAWWWGGMFLGGMLTESPPSSQRLITLSVPACFFIVLAVMEMLKLAQDALNQRWERLIVTATVTTFAAISLYSYFILFIPNRVYGGPHALLATEIAPRLNELKEEHYFYFVGAPEMYWGFSTIPYLVQGVKGEDLRERVTPETLEWAIPRDRGMVFVILPARRQELAAIETVFPDGVLESYDSPATGRPMVSLYVVSKQE